MDPVDLILAVVYGAIIVVFVATAFAFIGPVPEACT